jgi:hypothetical protein
MTKVIIFNLQNAPRNFLAPVGDRYAYITAFVNELRDFGDLRPESYPLCWNIIERMYRSVKPGDPWPCLEDLRRVLEHEAEVQNRPNLLTVARAVQNLCAVLGEASKIRMPASLYEE